MLRTPPLPATHVRVGTDHEHFSGAHCRLHARSSNRELTRAVRPRVAATLCPGLHALGAATMSGSRATVRRPAAASARLPELNKPAAGRRTVALEPNIVAAPRAWRPGQSVAATRGRTARVSSRLEDRACRRQ